MNLRKKADDIFHAPRSSRNNLYELARVFWPADKAESISSVSNWRDLLNLDDPLMGTNGIGGLMSFMEGDMALAYLPAWLVLSYEQSFPEGGFLAPLVVTMDDKGKVAKEQVERFKVIEAGLNREQRNFVADVFEAIANRRLKGKADLRDRLLRIAKYWRRELHPAPN